jgi:hypothetical protein
MKYFSVLIFLFINISTNAQSAYNPNALPNDYNSRENPYYWKNRKPYQGYWQQDVYYKIDAQIDETTDIISGSEQLKYWNNSPDTLQFVYFHLYQQAFVKGGHIENLNLNNNVKQKFGRYEASGKGCIIESIRIDGKELEQIKDFSVVKIILPYSLLPNEAITFDIKFSTCFDNGSQRRRFKKFDSYGSTHYDGVHWYPRICVYDAKMGWDTYQHLGKEFYGDFGTFDVKLNFASNFIVEATGVLQNEQEVLPASLKSKLNIANFLNKPWESAPSIIIPYNKSERKTWNFYAENVHDFAFTADPNYRFASKIILPKENFGQGIKIVALVQEPHAAGWANAIDFTAKVIETYSKNFGMYSWPKIVVADAQDGMEYPMLTLDGGYDPNYRDLIAHEVGHMWYFGQVGNNETYRAALDEGFTQFIESYALQLIDGKNIIEPNYRSKYYKKYKEDQEVMMSEVYNGYLFDAVIDEDESINQISDGFNGALNHGGGYRHVYYKTATMLWNLQYVLGDTLFLEAMKHYFNQWKFCHPYFEDFRNSIIQYTHTDLNWFLDEWMETTKKIDYKIESVKKIKGESKYNYEITFKRMGRMQMPIDLLVEQNKSDSKLFYIPNTWFIKNTIDTSTQVLPKWYGWDKLHPTYQFNFSSDQKIKNIILDPTYRLADINLMNNQWKCSTKWKFDSQISNTPDWKHYVIKWRPDIWYNNIDGIKAGLHIEGSYMNLKNKFWLTTWFNTTATYDNIFSNESLGNEPVIFPVSFNFKYETPINSFIRKSKVFFDAKYLDGLIGSEWGVKTQASKQNELSFSIKVMNRYYDKVYNADVKTDPYILYPENWNINEWNNTLRISFKRNYRYTRGNGVIRFNAISSTLISTQNYSYINASVINKNKLGKLDFNTRTFIQYGWGNIPVESALYLAGANPEEMMENKFVRSRGFLPTSFYTFGNKTSNFQYGGGLNLRGYNNYYAIDQKGDDLNTYSIHQVKSGASVNAEMGFGRMVKFKPKITRNSFAFNPYLFGDAGVAQYQNNDGKNVISQLRADAGLGATFTLKRFWLLEEVDPLIVRFDMPFFLNRPPFEEAEYFKLRWLISVEASF